jgi:DNA-binding transcriptional ArsR family regulator
LLLDNNKNMPDKPENQNKFKSTVLNALSDPIRLEIITFLRDGERCVCEIIPHLNLIQPLVSRHLKILKDAGIVRCRKDGTKRMYSVVDPRIYNVIDALTPELISVLTKEAFENLVCC